ncbi:hypothetical protein Tco_1194936 [Tanacetum coccineum]
MAWMDFHELVLTGDYWSIGIQNCVVDRRVIGSVVVKYSSNKGLNRKSNSRDDGSFVSAGGETFRISFELEGATKDVKHAVAIASVQKNKGSLEAESIVRAASTRVRFHLSKTPFCLGVRGIDV